jgi:hypothetical protein
MKTFSFTKTIKYVLDILDTPIRGIKIYRLKVNDSSKERTYSSTEFCRTKDIKELQRGGYSDSTGWCLAKPSLIKSLQKWGWTDKDGSCDHFSSGIYKDPFSSFKRNRGIFLRDDDSCHMIFDVNNEPLPVAVRFDYIDGNMRNGSYDLAKALDILNARDDIYIIHNIESVPYYNRSSSCSSCISFLWRPSVEDYRKMWDRCKKIDKKYASCRMHQAIFEEDLLGLRAGGAAKYDEHYGCDGT